MTSEEKTNGTIARISTTVPGSSLIYNAFQNAMESSSFEATSGNIKWNSTFLFNKTLSGQIAMVYLAPDIIPQGKIDSLFSVDLGLKKIVQKGKGEIDRRVKNLTQIYN